ncbi:MAG: hypothetical protein ABS81_03225 [Pseudonocardia sp. SCN 72-86]|nr:MAG: hypothetical protein ABS81_03225 [Pseudonocardia sp. SCN 72-86]
MSERTTADLRRLDEAEIREILGVPEPPVVDKIDRVLSETARRFIAHSPFVCLATAGERGADCSPRGDGPGFVLAHGAHTLSVPDRTGNALADSFRNILESPLLGMLFLVPGMRETLRVNGTGFVTDDIDLRRRHEADGRMPKLVLVVDVDECYFHCGKALIRSALWDATTYLPVSHTVFDSNVFSLRDIEKGALSMSSAGLNDALEQSYVVDR